MRVLVTHASGFLGFHLARRLAAEGNELHLSFERDDAMAAARAELLHREGGFLRHVDPVAAIASAHPEVVVHLGAVAGSVGSDGTSAARELATFGALLEASRQAGARHLVLGSGASVYGANEKVPFGVEQLIDRPLSVEGGAQRAEELLGHGYAHEHGFPVTALRFFGVYGPWGRVEQAPLAFARALHAGRPVRIAGGGHQRRDFTFVDDAVEALVRAVERPAEATEWGAPFAVHNVGSGSPVPLSQLLALVEAGLGKKALTEEEPLPRTQLPHTWADVRELQQAYGFRPRTPLGEGVLRTLTWWSSPEAEAWRNDQTGHLA